MNKFFVAYALVAFSSVVANQEVTTIEETTEVVAPKMVVEETVTPTTEVAA